MVPLVGVLTTTWCAMNPRYGASLLRGTLTTYHKTWHYEEFPRNPLISAPSGIRKAISLTIVHTVIHMTCKDDTLVILAKYSLGNIFFGAIAGL